MKALAKKYIFDASAKTVTFTGDVVFTLDQILLITNVTDNLIIYNFADPACGGSITNNILTLDYDTTGMSDMDVLQVFVDVPNYLSIFGQLIHPIANGTHGIGAVREL